MKKVVSLAFVLLLFSIALFVRPTRPIEAEPETIYIRSDSSIEGTDKIQRDGNLYTFTSNIYGEIVVERDNVVVDGKGYNLQGIGAEDSKGIYLSGRSNVIIENIEIKTYDYGIFLYDSSNNIIVTTKIKDNTIGIYLSESSFNEISGNNITTNSEQCNGSGIWLANSSENNSIIQNSITYNMFHGIRLHYSSNHNNILENNITNNGWGIGLEMSDNNSVSSNEIVSNEFGIFLSDPSSSNSILRNNITANNQFGIWIWFTKLNSIFENNLTNNGRGIVLQHSPNNTIYNNNFRDNNQQVDSEFSTNFWDDGDEGNYWSDYEERYPDAKEVDGSGVWDIPYVIDENNQDNYPLMNPISRSEIISEAEIHFWMQWWFWTMLAIVAIILAGAAYFLKKRKQPTPTTPALPIEGTLQDINSLRAATTVYKRRLLKTPIHSTAIFLFYS